MATIELPCCYEQHASLLSGLLAIPARAAVLACGNASFALADLGQ
jgi:hypothetical protein